MSDNLDKKKYLALILVVLLIGLALFTVWSKEREATQISVDPPTATDVKPTITAQPQPTPTPTATLSPTSTPTQIAPTVTPIPTSTPVPTVTVLMDGQLVLDTEMIAGIIHEFYIQMSKQLIVEVQEEEDGAISFTGEPPWVDVTGIISDTGVVTATGTGVVAGYLDISVWMTGTMHNDFYTATLTMGSEHKLPGGEAGVYLIHGPYEAYTLNPNPELDARIIITNNFNTFVTDFNTGMQNGNTEWLYNHLHPAVFERYDPDACQIYLERTVQPEFGINVLEFIGPKIWSWEMDGETIEIENAYTAISELTIKGEVNQADVHFAIVNGEFTWFTTCINPEE